MQFDSRIPVYVQIIRYFKVKIASGALAMGAEIPSRRELAKRWKINPNTVQRAFKEMEEAKLIYTEGNMPSKVTNDEATIAHIRETLVQEAIEQFISSIHTLQIPLEEVIVELEKQYANAVRKGARTDD
ncbi:MAG TPA: GntR family transcriptional regulator [Pseudogracilibacillus sp.]|nr:GntR family transcriptional regulator [Pseudogracilibacillus sp.]